MLLYTVSSYGTDQSVVPGSSETAAVSANEPLKDTLSRAIITAERDAAASRTAPIQKISRAAIERSGASGLHEILRTFSGVSIRDYGGIGGLKTVSVRDIGAQHTAICYDGVVISDAQNGQTDISRFNLDNISEITMETGGSDDIFRAARLINASGILSLSTISDKDSFNAAMAYASFNTYRPHIFLNRSFSDRISVGASLDYLYSGGAYPFSFTNGSLMTQERRLGSDVHTLSSETTLRVNTADSGSLTAKIRFFDSERGLPGTVVFYVQEPTERLWDKELSASMIYKTGSHGRWRFSETVNFDMSRNRYTNSSVHYEQDDRYNQKELSSSGIAEYRFNDHLRFTFAEDLLLNTLYATIPECPQPKRLSSVSAISGQWKDHRLTVTGSLCGTVIREKAEKGKAASPINRLAPSLSLSFKIAEGLRVRASYRDGFRVPTFNDLYYTRIGNGELRPEKARQYNIGLTYSLYNKRRDTCPFHLTASLDLYHNIIRDKILAVPTMFIWKMRNLGEVRMTGADVSVSGSVTPTKHTVIRLSANYSARRAIDVTDPSAKNYRHQIQYTPRHSGNIFLDVGTRWADLSYTLNAVGRRWSLPQNIPANEMPSYFDHSISVGRSFVLGKIGIRISAEALNLSDKNYEVVRFYPMPGRNYRITIKFTY